MPKGRPVATSAIRVLGRPGAVAGLGLVAAGTCLTALVASRRTRPLVQRVDDCWYVLVQQTRSARRTAVSRLLDIGFGTTLDWSARVVVTALLVRRRRWRALGGWASTIVLGELCIGPIKSAIGRIRPDDSIVQTSDTSYPSGHAIAAATTAPGIVIALMPRGPARQWFLGGAVGVAAVTALSRSDLNAHWISDCVGGFCLGTGFAFTAPAVADAVAAAQR